MNWYLLALMSRLIRLANAPLPVDPNAVPAAQPPQPAFDPHGNHYKTGKYFANFFSKVSRGDDQRPEKPYEPVLDLSGHEGFMGELLGHTGHFDEHIATSIPTYREAQIRKGQALVKAFGNRPLKMLDIGGSEGSFAKAITAASRGQIQTTVLDPNPDMAKFFNGKSQVPGATYDQRAFHRGWTEDDGTEIPAMNADNSQQRYDIIHEAMVFQFVSNDRGTHVREAKRLLAPNGLFLTEEKVRTPQEEWAKNEQYKDQNYKNRFYSQSMLAAKQKMVGFQQDQNETKAVGMVDNMVSEDDFEKILLDSFRSVMQYWDSGNFKGYACSDDPARVQTFVKSVGNMKSPYTMRPIPRAIAPRIQASRKRMMDKSAALAAIVETVLPAKEHLERMTLAAIKTAYVPTVLTMAQHQGLPVQRDEVEAAVAHASGNRPQFPEFDIRHYHEHM